MHAERRSWWLVIVAALLLRAPLWFLPGLGRDEAMYLYWAHHPQPAYAPLLQWLLATLDAIPSSLSVTAPWVLRIPSIAAGILVAWFFTRWLEARGSSAGHVIGSTAVFVLGPWQTYAGSILHPDDLQLATIFGFAWARAAGSRHGAWWAAVLAPYTKPSGLAVTAVALFWLARRRAFGARTPLWIGAGAVLALLPSAFLHEGLVRTLLEFGSVGTQTSLLTRFGLLLLGLFALAGPIPFVALFDARHERRREAEHVLAAVLGLGFLGALVINGQVKGNWMLPAVFLLWPVNAGVPRPRAIGVSLLAITIALSAALSAGFARPDLARRAEQGAPGWIPSYLGVAGQRETQVAAARAWWQRCAEYRAVDCSLLPTVLPDGRAISSIVSDDYGLAAQWAVRCPTAPVTLVLPFDPLERNVLVSTNATVVLAVQVSVEDLVGTREVEFLAPIAHPITGQPIQRAVVVEGGLRTTPDRK